MSLRDLLSSVVASEPDRVAVIGSGRRLTYRELDAQATALASSWLRAELQPFDRVALWMRNGPELLICYFACWKAGLIPVPIDLRYQLPQVRFILKNCEARIVVADSDKQTDLTAVDNLTDLAQLVIAGDAITLADAVAFESLVLSTNELSGPPFLGDQLAVIFYTSGTTSRPKGVVHSDLRLWRRVAKIVRECRIGPESVGLANLSLLRPLGLQVQALAILASGGCVVTLPRFSPDAFWQSYNQPPAKTLLTFTPDALSAVLHHPAARSADYSGLQLCLVGSDAVPTSLHALFRDITGMELVEMCGMTETGPYAMNPPFDLKKPGSIGQALEGTLLRIVDNQGCDVPAEQSGQILVRTSDMMVGYWNNSLETFQVLRDGWLFTGDLGRSDADGYVWFCGRMKDVIVRDGRNLSPTEVESVLGHHPAIQESVAVGVDDPPHGQVVEVFVRLRPNVVDLPVIEELRTLVTQQMESLAVPRSIYYVSEWPRTAQGKIDRKRLQWIAAAGGVQI
ncbi:long-chain-fatty-acid--CoA ligase LcfB [soil metagenome]